MDKTDKLQRRIAVFCASSNGVEPEYLAAARALGQSIAARGYGLVYGGASVGLMGALADAALEAGGKVIGVIPDVLMDHEIGHRGLTELHVVHTMHERKALMARCADAFLALPGGYGTMAEFMEAVTWAQLRIHTKPCVLVNVRGYYDALLRFFDVAVDAGMIQVKNRGLIHTARDEGEALALIEHEWDQSRNATLKAPLISEAVK